MTYARNYVPAYTKTLVLSIAPKPTGHPAGRRFSLARSFALGLAAGECIRKRFHKSSGLITKVGQLLVFGRFRLGRGRRFGGHELEAKIEWVLISLQGIEAHARDDGSPFKVS
jgi:hypothetical protein